MARRYSTQPIPPFPPEIDRDAFGHWLSGFTDGEGSFVLYWAHGSVGACRFMLNLRRDDRDILLLIQSFFGCGQVFDPKKLHSSHSPGSKPQTRYYAQRSRDLLKVIVPHFERYPLRAKKSRDFTIWKEAVRFVCSISTKPITSTGNTRRFLPKWREEHAAYFGALRDALCEQREYVDVEPMLRRLKPRLKMPESGHELFD